MIDVAEARRLVASYVSGLQLADGAAILDEQTVVLPYGWVFYYQSETFARTRNLFASYVGSGGVLVEASSGRLFELGSARPLEWHLRNFEETGDPFLALGTELELMDAELSDRKEAVGALRRVLGLPIAEAGRILDLAASGARPVLSTASAEVAEALKTDLLRLGITARRIPRAVR